MLHLIVTAALLSTSPVVGEEKVDLEGIKCPISGRPVVESKSVDYKDAKVYFCCPNCVAKFDSDPSELATKANAQLVSTKQAKQIACPFSGRDLNEDATVKVAGTTVTFCCFNCQGRAEAAEEDERLTMIFADKPFAKGFKIVKKDEDK